jgi:hypothetical protein
LNFLIKIESALWVTKIASSKRRCYKIDMSENGSTFNASSHVVVTEGQRPQGENRGGPAEVWIHTPPTPTSSGESMYSRYDSNTNTRVNYKAFSPPKPGNKSSPEGPSAAGISQAVKNIAPLAPTLEQIATAREVTAHQESSRLAEYAATQIKSRINMAPIVSTRDRTITGLVRRGNFLENMPDNKGKILLRPRDEELLMQLIESNKAAGGTEVTLNLGFSTFKIEKTVEEGLVVSQEVLQEGGAREFVRANDLAGKKEPYGGKLSDEYAVYLLNLVQIAKDIAAGTNISAKDYGPRIAVNGFTGRNHITGIQRVNPTDLLSHRPSAPPLTKAA